MSPLPRLAPLGLLLAVAALAGPAAAQPAQPFPTVESVYARPGYPTIAVYVLGQVAAPGKWRVETDTELLDLLSVTRPANVSIDQAGVIEQTSVRLYREGQGGTRQLLLESEFNALITGAQAGTALAEGDIIEVMTSVRPEPVQRRITFVEVLGIVSSVAGIAGLVVTLLR